MKPVKAVLFLALLSGPCLGQRSRPLPYGNPNWRPRTSGQNDGLFYQIYQGPSVRFPPRRQFLRGANDRASKIEFEHRDFRGGKDTGHSSYSSLYPDDKTVNYATRGASGLGADGRYVPNARPITQTYSGAPQNGAVAQYAPNARPITQTYSGAPQNGAVAQYAPNARPITQTYSGAPQNGAVAQYAPNARPITQTYSGAPQNGAVAQYAPNARPITQTYSGAPQNGAVAQYAPNARPMTQTYSGAPQNGAVAQYAPNARPVTQTYSGAPQNLYDSANRGGTSLSTKSRGDGSGNFKVRLRIGNKRRHPGDNINRARFLDEARKRYQNYDGGVRIRVGHSLETLTDPNINRNPTNEDGLENSKNRYRTSYGINSRNQIKNNPRQFPSILSQQRKNRDVMGSLQQRHQEPTIHSKSSLNKVIRGSHGKPTTANHPLQFPGNFQLTSKKNHKSRTLNDQDPSNKKPQFNFSQGNRGLTGQGDQRNLQSGTTERYSPLQLWRGISQNRGKQYLINAFRALQSQYNTNKKLVVFIKSKKGRVNPSGIHSTAGHESSRSIEIDPGVNKVRYADGRGVEIHPTQEFPNKNTESEEKNSRFTKFHSRFSKEEEEDSSEEDANGRRLRKYHQIRESVHKDSDSEEKDSKPKRKLNQRSSEQVEGSEYVGKRSEVKEKYSNEKRSSKSHQSTKTRYKDSESEEEDPWFKVKSHRRSSKERGSESVEKLSGGRFKYLNGERSRTNHRSTESRYQDFESKEKDPKIEIDSYPPLSEERVRSQSSEDKSKVRIRYSDGRRFSAKHHNIESRYEDFVSGEKGSKIKAKGGRSRTAQRNRKSKYRDSASEETDSRIQENVYLRFSEEYEEDKSGSLEKRPYVQREISDGRRSTNNHRNRKTKYEDSESEEDLWFKRKFPQRFSDDKEFKSVEKSPRFKTRYSDEGRSKTNHEIEKSRYKDYESEKRTSRAKIKFPPSHSEERGSESAEKSSEVKTRYSHGAQFGTHQNGGFIYDAEPKKEDFNHRNRFRARFSNEEWVESAEKIPKVRTRFFDSRRSKANQRSRESNIEDFGSEENDSRFKIKFRSRFSEERGTESAEKIPGAKIRNYDEGRFRTNHHRQESIYEDSHTEENDSRLHLRFSKVGKRKIPNREISYSDGSISEQYPRKKPIYKNHDSEEKDSTKFHPRFSEELKSERPENSREIKISYSGGGRFKPNHQGRESRYKDFESNDKDSRVHINFDTRFLDEDRLSKTHTQNYKKFNSKEVNENRNAKTIRANQGTSSFYHQDKNLRENRFKDGSRLHPRFPEEDKSKSAFFQKIFESSERGLGKKLSDGERSNTYTYSPDDDTEERLNDKDFSRFQKYLEFRSGQNNKFDTISNDQIINDELSLYLHTGPNKSVNLKENNSNNVRTNKGATKLPSDQPKGHEQPNHPKFHLKDVERRPKSSQDTSLQKTNPEFRINMYYDRRTQSFHYLNDSVIESLRERDEESRNLKSSSRAEPQPKPGAEWKTRSSTRERDEHSLLFGNSRSEVSQKLANFEKNRSEKNRDLENIDLRGNSQSSLPFGKDRSNPKHQNLSEEQYSLHLLSNSRKNKISEISKSVEEPKIFSEPSNSTKDNVVSFLPMFSTKNVRITSLNGGNKNVKLNTQLNFENSDVERNVGESGALTPTIKILPESNKETKKDHSSSSDLSKLLSELKTQNPSLKDLDIQSFGSSSPTSRPKIAAAESNRESSSALSRILSKLKNEDHEGIPSITYGKVRDGKLDLKPIFEGSER